MHILLEAVRVLSELRRSLVVKRVVRVRLQEEENQTHDDVSDIEDGLPVGSENVQAHVALSVYVRVVDISVAVDDGGLVGVLGGHAHREVEPAADPDAVLLARQVHRQTELHDVRLVHTHRDKRRLVQILHILSKPDLARTAAGYDSAVTSRSFLFFFLSTGNVLLLPEHLVNGRFYGETDV